ncbi:WhiB family transcriptional regulator [Kitasatospora cineracea]|uniref:Transcriptional regulator WhiB n=1 Tax=Kitasatospora cineracea TaxID=88074 RepID=A0A3N4S185_9ACTN|nr:MULTISPECIES: WhiB family transcriptional regulator [Kitasatospora]ROR42227.1 WhiB family redox-sensing transcriptional regulator [Kitasatospora cineracea]RPE32740.1 WhiB family redox-sensing transcriptional regulator [Kitasatospora cineracea]WNW39822.1 WhiB family transcriptional regulator [Streptomyces sp. Li-HN-5-13]
MSTVITPPPLPSVPTDKTVKANQADPPEVTLMQLTAIDEADSLGLPIPCRAFDPEVFFAETPADVEYAKSLCGTCPVKAACLTGALERREPWGVWGGELFVQGVVVARKRPRGRPRKTEVMA